MLVAGGLGERLATKALIRELPVELATGKSFLRVVCGLCPGQMQDRARKDSGDSTLVIPLAIATSDDTDAKTKGP